MADSLVKQSLKELMRELAAGSEDLFERFTRSSGKGGIATGTDFEPEEQQLFLRYIGKEVARLKLKEKELRLIKSMMPTTDLRVYTIMSPEDPECPTQDEDTLLRHEFCSRWRYVSYATQYESFSGRRYTIEWDHEFLGAESPHDPLVLFSSKKMLPKTPHGGEPTTRISSQLLLYRNKLADKPTRIPQTQQDQQMLNSEHKKPFHNLNIDRPDDEMGHKSPPWLTATTVIGK
ncbi:hypothetical protein EG327_001345 [Venturia inaequalis]|uniref:Uncharacterized protein n=1 Tax=Venturia inaequalis TaxID=5025 RepID=A0A8H3VHZ5_VENIN|nr:hypothetical protein EG327_001345 [Venturia inaequalis]